MKYLKHSIAGAAVALAGLTAFGQTEISVVASDNGTIQTEGVSDSPWFHNAQVAGDFESYGVSTFVISAADFGYDSVTGIDSIEISYTQANASFTADGPVELFLTLDPAVAGADYSALTHNSSASGIDDAQFSDSPSTQSIGTGTFTEVADGTQDTYTLDVSAVEADLVAAINSGAGFGIILSANGSEGAVTYAGIQSRDYPNSIILNVTATGESGGGGGEPSDGPALIISGVLDGPLPGGLPKAIEFYAVEDIADLSLYGFGSANNGGGSDGEEVVMAGSASAGDFLYLATEAEAFTSVFGFAPDFVDGAAAINGDDALELYYEGQVIDTFGDINVDGNGEPWEYLNSWAYRVDETTANPAFAIGDWTFGGADALDGLDEAGVAAAFPFGTYSPGEAPAGLPWDADGLQVDDVVRSPWFGNFAIGGDGWINHVEQKWLYVGLVESAESMFIYSLFLDGWVWSSIDTYPLMYDFDNSRWVYYLVIDDVTTLLYDYATGEWTEG